MNNDTKDGGPAFPEPIIIDADGEVYPESGGMTLRDYFAGQVLASMASSFMIKLFEDGIDAVEAKDMTVKSSYAIADAMLVERSRSDD